MSNFQLPTMPRAMRNQAPSVNAPARSRGDMDRGMPEVAPPTGARSQFPYRRGATATHSGALPSLAMVSETRTLETGATDGLARGPSVPAGGSVWGSGAGGSKLFTKTLLPGQIEILVNWYTPTVKRISPGEKHLIQTTACAIAKSKDSDVLNIRSDIHNTSYTGTRDPRTGQKRVKSAPWHYTVEFQNRITKKWTTAHVYTETYTKRDNEGRTVKTHQGLRDVDGIVTRNPELWNHDRPNHAPELFQNYKVIV